MKIFSLKKGDRVVESLTKIVADENIDSGCFLALGALSQVDLMIYDLATKEYSSKTIDGPLEVGNFIAVIAKDPEGKPHIHPHITVCDKNFDAHCGHLKEGVVSATLEVMLFEGNQQIQRYADSEIGLNLIK